MLTWKEVESYLKRSDRIIFPIGSTEQHGTKAILGTDHLVAEKISMEVGKRTQTLVAPTLVVGMSEHHLSFPGTMSFSKEVYYLVIQNLLTRFYRHGFKHILIINGHGGNQRTVNVVRHQLKNELPDLSIAFVNWWDLPEAEKYLEKHFGKWEGMHATAGETSIMMHVYPKMISHKKVPKGKCPPKKEYEKANVPDDYRRLFPDGVWYADPNLANRKHGKNLTDLCIKSLIPKLKKWDFENF